MSPHEKFKFASAAELLAKASSLGVEIPFADDLSPLWQPIEIAGHRVPNRLVVQPMEGCDADETGAPTELSLRRYRRFAAGGSGVVWFEATTVTDEARSNPRQLYLNAANVGSFARLVEAARRVAREQMGPAHRPLCILQLTHPGRYCRRDGQPRPIIAQHNAVLDAAQKLPADHPLIADAELDRLQDAFVQAAELALQAGFDGVDVKACHGYLISELLAAHERPGKYGGTLENRARFLLETVQRIRSRLPDLIVTSRISAYDGLAYPYGFGGDPGDADAGVADPAGFDEAVVLASQLRELGCPLLNVSIGNPYHQPHIGRPFDKPVVGQPRPDEHPLVGVARLLRVIGALQQACPSLPIVGTGYSWLRQYFPNVGAAILRDAKAAFIGIGRLALAYPECVRDLASNGKLDPRKVCVACSGCTQIMRDGGRAGCVVRDREVYATEYRQGRQRHSAKEAHLE